MQDHCNKVSIIENMSDCVTEPVKIGYLTNVPVAEWSKLPFTRTRNSVVKGSIPTQFRAFMDFTG